MRSKTIRKFARRTWGCLRMLEISALQCGYARQTVLRDINLSVGRGQVVAILGANGVGKSTLLKTIAGALDAQAGTVRLDGQALDSLPAYERARRGLVLVPEGQQSFPLMSVQENLLVAAKAFSERRAKVYADLDAILDLFPRLAERSKQKAGSLSGGERQMLAIARAMLCKPRVLLLDEPSHGLAPMIVEQVAEIVGIISRDTPTLIVEQNLSIPRQVATHVVVLEYSHIVDQGPPQEILNSERVVATYLGV